MLLGEIKLALLKRSKKKTTTTPTLMTVFRVFGHVELRCKEQKNRIQASKNECLSPKKPSTERVVEEFHLVVSTGGQV